MNSELRSFLNRNNINYKKITLKNSARIIDTDTERYVIKNHNNSLKNTYRYLNSRSFNYFPKLLMETDDYNIFEYIDNIDIEDDEKAKDIMYLVGLLHAKTSYYKEIDIDNYKELYENIISKLNYLNNYYLDIMGVIDKEVYMAPSHYLLARNINLVFSSLDRSHNLIDKWYKIIDKKKKIRLVTIHNNLNINNYLRSDKGYLLSWEKSKLDMPIYDILPFYRKYALTFPFDNLLPYYESIYPLLEEEKLLLVALMLLPNKLEFDKREFLMCQEIRIELDYLYKTLELSDNYLKLPPPKNSTTN